MKVIVTGSSGYIGSRLATTLRARGDRVLGIDRRDSPVELDGFIQTDLLQTDAYREALDGADAIYHLAASKGDWGIRAEEYYRDNLLATQALLDAAGPGPRQWVFFSTVAVLGPSARPLTEAADHAPANAYGASKAECETLFQRYAKRTGSTVEMIRPSVVFGPENPCDTNIFRLIDAIFRRRFVMVGAGAEIKTTSYIENLVAATLFAVDQPPPRGHAEALHYVDQPAPSTRALVDLICAALGRAKPALQIPRPVASTLARVGDTLARVSGRDLPITSARVEKFCTPTHFSAALIRSRGFAAPVTLPEAMGRTVDWYLADKRTPARAA